MKSVIMEIQLEAMDVLPIEDPLRQAGCVLEGVQPQLILVLFALLVYIKMIQPILLFEFLYVETDLRKEMRNVTTATQSMEMAAKETAQQLRQAGFELEEVM